MRRTLSATALALGCLGSWPPAPALAGRCSFDTDIADITSGQVRRRVQDRLAHGWTLGFEQVADTRTAFVTVSLYRWGGATIPAGQRFTAQFEDGTVMHLASTQPAQAIGVGIHTEYTFRLGTTQEALLVFSNLDLERFQMDLFGELFEGQPDRYERLNTRQNASCILEPLFTGRL